MGTAEHEIRFWIVTWSDSQSGYKIDKDGRTINSHSNGEAYCEMDVRNGGPTCHLWQQNKCLYNMSCKTYHIQTNQERSWRTIATPPDVPPGSLIYFDHFKVGFSIDLCAQKRVAVVVGNTMVVYLKVRFHCTKIDSVLLCCMLCWSSLKSIFFLIQNYVSLFKYF